MKTLSINFTIPVGDYLKLRYRPTGTTTWTTVTPNLFFNQTPYQLTVSSNTLYEFELTTICSSGNCGDGSDPVYITEGATTT